ncbi:PREDICTED: transcription factor EC-like, partial [Pterocles gutturalis]|uniref:transcription factor EC-like n=1 Tax=Pterocles gutturalis TaxID=240206 RepID=UPI000528AF35
MGKEPGGEYGDRQVPASGIVLLLSSGNNQLVGSGLGSETMGAGAGLQSGGGSPGDSPSARASLVQTHLENQSRYHIQQSQRHQVKQYLTLDTKLSSQTLSLSHSHTIQPVGVTPILRNGHMPPVSDIGTPESPVTKLLALGGEHENAMEEVIEDIINMESSFNDEGIGCSETPLLMQRT